MGALFVTATVVACAAMFLSGLVTVVLISIDLATDFRHTDHLTPVIMPAYYAMWVTAILTLVALVLSVVL